MGINKPDLSKLSEITEEIFFPIFSREELLENKSETAIGVGLTVPCVSVSSNEKAFDDRKSKIKNLKKNFIIIVCLTFYRHRMS